MATERRLIIEGIKYGRPFRESLTLHGEAHAERQVATFKERIEHPPEGGLRSHHPTILRVEVLTREVTPWESKQVVGHPPVVDAWLASDRHRLHDMEDVRELTEGVPS